MRRNSVLLAILALVAGCSAHESEPSTASIDVPGAYEVEYEYVPPPHPDFNFYQDHYGHRYEQPWLNATHGGYGSYGVLYFEE